MRRLVLAIALLAGCKSMGGLGSGLGHVASGLGHVASGVGHVASAVEHVAAPVAIGFGKVVGPVAAGAAKAAPTLARVAATSLDVAETVVEASALTDPLEPGPDEVQEPYVPDPTVDLCLDCPDAGNCSSCPSGDR